MLCVNCLAGSVVTPLAVNFYNAHLARQTLVNTFHQVYQAWLQFISGVLNRLNACLRAKSDPGSVAEYLAALRHKNTHLLIPIPVTAVQSAKLLTDCGRKQTRVPNLVWLVDSLPASNGTVHLKLLRITEGTPGAVISRKFLAYSHKFLLPVLNISAASAGCFLIRWYVDWSECASYKGGKY
jgi:hypothetical protein